MDAECQLRCSHCLRQWDCWSEVRRDVSLCPECREKLLAEHHSYVLDKPEAWTRLAEIPVVVGKYWLARLYGENLLPINKLAYFVNWDFLYNSPDGDLKGLYLYMHDFTFYLMRKEEQYQDGGEGMAREEIGCSCEGEGCKACEG